MASKAKAMVSKAKATAADKAEQPPELEALAAAAKAEALSAEMEALAAEAEALAAEAEALVDADAPSNSEAANEGDEAEATKEDDDSKPPPCHASIEGASPGKIFVGGLPKETTASGSYASRRGYGADASGRFHPYGR